MNRTNTTRTLWLCAAILGAAGCASPPSTPYRAIAEGQGPFGYATEALDDTLYRIDFNASIATPQRTAMAFALFRAAELAQTLNMIAFTVVEGPVDRTLLEGEDLFSSMHSLEHRRVKARKPIPMPIFIPKANADRPQPKLVILRVRMHEKSPAIDGPRTFMTREVIEKLGSRIVRGESA